MSSSGPHGGEAWRPERRSRLSGAERWNICPRITDTDRWAYSDREWGQLLGEYQPGQLMRGWTEDIPLRRVGTPEDVAALVAFLASDDTDYITGQTVNVGGGLIMS